MKWIKGSRCTHFEAGRARWNFSCLILYYYYTTVLYYRTCCRGRGGALHVAGRVRQLQFLQLGPVREWSSMHVLAKLWPHFCRPEPNLDRIPAQTYRKANWKHARVRVLALLSQSPRHHPFPKFTRKKDEPTDTWNHPIICIIGENILAWPWRKKRHFTGTDF